MHHDTPRSRGGFRHFFFRGLAIVLPTALTIWLIVIAYQFIKTNIAAPINSGLQSIVLAASPWPYAEARDYDEAFELLPVARRQEWATLSESISGTAVVKLDRRRDWMQRDAEAIALARRSAMTRWWQSIRIGTWQVLDLFGLIVAVILIYMIGVVVTSFIGRRLYRRGEVVLQRVPFVGRVYPSIKQLTDFFFAEDSEKLQFNRVVAAEYPRKGIWSLGLVTGTTMRTIQERSGVKCLTIFIPTSPTPFTGFVITVPEADTVELPISIEDALKFVVSGGVVLPPSQAIPATPRGVPAAAVTTKMEGTVPHPGRE